MKSSRTSYNSSKSIPSVKCQRSRIYLLRQDCCIILRCVFKTIPLHQSNCKNSQVSNRSIEKNSQFLRLYKIITFFSEIKIFLLCNSKQNQFSRWIPPLSFRHFSLVVAYIFHSHLPHSLAPFPSFGSSSLIVTIP